MDAEADLIYKFTIDGIFFLMDGQEDGYFDEKIGYSFIASTDSCAGQVIKLLYFE